MLLAILKPFYAFWVFHPISMHRGAAVSFQLCFTRPCTNGLHMYIPEIISAGERGQDIVTLIYKNVPNCWTVVHQCFEHGMQAGIQKRLHWTAFNLRGLDAMQVFPPLFVWFSSSLASCLNRMRAFSHSSHHTHVSLSLSPSNLLSDSPSVPLFVTFLQIRMTQVLYYVCIRQKTNVWWSSPTLNMPVASQSSLLCGSQVSVQPSLYVNHITNYLHTPLLLSQFPQSNKARS